MIYRFKVCFEDYEEIFREIEIQSTQNFEDFHHAIQKAINFDSSHLASFYISDYYWRKGMEITLKNKEENPEPKKVMSNCKLASFIEDPHQKFVYLFDFSMMWTFNIELIKILPQDLKASYPRCIKSVGMARPQYKTANVPLVIIEEEEEEDLAPQVEKIFQSEEGYDNQEEVEDVMVDGEEVAGEVGEEAGEQEEGFESEFHENGSAE